MTHIGDKRTKNTKYNNVALFSLKWGNTGAWFSLEKHHKLPKTLLVKAGFSWRIICPSIPIFSAWEKHRLVFLGGAVQCVVVPVLSLVGWNDTAHTGRFCTGALKKGLAVCFLTNAGFECKAVSWFKGCGEQVRAFTGFLCLKGWSGWLHFQVQKDGFSFISLSLLKRQSWHLQLFI